MNNEFLIKIGKLDDMEVYFLFIFLKIFLKESVVEIFLKWGFLLVNFVGF